MSYFSEVAAAPDEKFIIKINFADKYHINSLKHLVMQKVWEKHQIWVHQIHKVG